MSESFIELHDESILLRFPRGAFTDVLLRGVEAHYGGHCDSGTFVVAPWTEERVDRWRRDDHRWRTLGRRLRWAARALGREEITGGLIGTGASLAKIPLNPLDDRTVTIQDSRFTGNPDAAIQIGRP